MKKLHLVLVSLGVALLAAGCGGGSSGAATGGTTIPSAAVKITQTNAPVVAKGAATSSQAMADTGSSQAGVIGIVAQTSGQSRSVLDISLANFAKVRNMKLAPAAGVVGAIAGFPMTNPCVPSGSMSMDINDAGVIGTVDSGDVVTMSFANCNDGVSTMNGSMAFAITNLSGAMGGTGTVTTPLTAMFTLTFSNLSTKDNATNLTESINGDITFSTSDDGTSTTGTMSGSSLTMVSSVDGTFQMTSYNISFTTGNDPIATPGYSFSVSMTTADAAMGGSVTILTNIPFTGTGTGDPTAGEMVITGASNSTLTLTALSDGIHVQLVVDEDGAGTTFNPVAVTNPATGLDYTWADI